MKQFYVQVLTIGAMETLTEFAHAQASELKQLAQFVPRTLTEIENLIKCQVKAKWRDASYYVGFEIPQYVMPIVTIQLWEAVEVCADSMPNMNHSLLFMRDGVPSVPEMFPEVVACWPAVEPLIEDYE